MNRVMTWMLVVLAGGAPRVARALNIDAQDPTPVDCTCTPLDPVGQAFDNTRVSRNPIPFYLHGTGKTDAKLTTPLKFYFTEPKANLPEIPTVAQINQAIAGTRSGWLQVPPVYTARIAAEAHVSSTLPSALIQLREDSGRGRDTQEICSAPQRRIAFIHMPGVRNPGRRTWTHPGLYGDTEAMYGTLEGTFPTQNGGGKLFGRNAPVFNNQVRYYQILQNNNMEINGPAANIERASVAEAVADFVFAYTRGIKTVFVWTHSNGAVTAHKAWEVFNVMWDAAGPGGMTWGQFWKQARQSVGGQSDKMELFFYHTQAAMGYDSFMFYGDTTRNVNFATDGFLGPAWSGTSYEKRPYAYMEARGKRIFDINTDVSLRIEFLYNYADGMTADAGVYSYTSTVGQRNAILGIAAANLAHQGRTMFRETRGSAYLNIGAVNANDIVAEDWYAFGDVGAATKDSGGTWRYPAMPCGRGHNQVLAPWDFTQTNNRLTFSPTWRASSLYYVWSYLEPWEYGWRPLDWPNNNYYYRVTLNGGIQGTTTNADCKMAAQAGSLFLSTADAEGVFPDPTVRK